LTGAASIGFNDQGRWRHLSSGRDVSASGRSLLSATALDSPLLDSRRTLAIRTASNNRIADFFGFICSAPPPRKIRKVRQLTFRLALQRSKLAYCYDVTIPPIGRIGDFSKVLHGRFLKDQGKHSKVPTSSQ
jgi:hypothetical protein